MAAFRIDAFTRRVLDGKRSCIWSISCFIVLRGCLNSRAENAYEVQLKDPLHPELPATSYAVEILYDQYGVPTAYRMPLAAHTCKAKLILKDNP